MSMDTLLALAAVLSGGILNGSWVAPMKKLRGWRWEHGWFAYSVLGLLVAPWLVAAATSPALGESIRQAPAGAVALVLLFGLGWGTGSVLFGLGVDRMGLAVGYGLILGLIAPLGTLLPLIVLHPEQLTTARGASLLAGTAIVLGGIALLAKAGSLREQARSGAGAAAGARRFRTGLVICVLSGVFSPMLNFAFVFGAPLREAALRLGEAPSQASNTLWALALTAGFVPNAGYALYLIGRHRNQAEFAVNTAANLGWAALMGVLCYGSFLAYGQGAAALGEMGGIIGWPLFMSMSLIMSNALGAVTGEWKNAPGKAVRLSAAGIAALIAAIFVIGMGGGGD
jgi:L-rhamnose-H+ transport protein